MAKYIIDLDSLNDCLAFTSAGKINGKEYAYVNDVRLLIQHFPKYKVEETVTVETKVKYGTHSCED